MGWYSKIHFKGEVAVAGFPTHIELTSDYGVIYNEKLEVILSIGVIILHFIIKN